MHSTLLVARMEPRDASGVVSLFEKFDQSEMPGLMGTRRRQLFHFRGLYFHLQDFDTEDGRDTIEATKTHPSFVKISQDLKQFITAYDPETWRSPKDAIAQRFYHWTDGQ